MQDGRGQGITLGTDHPGNCSLEQGITLELFSAPAALMHVWYAGGALAIVLHTGDLTAAYFGKGWKNI